MMYQVISDKLLTVALEQLSKDPVLATLIEQYPSCAITPHTSYYRELVRSIIGQQLSVKAAASINGRFVELFDSSFPTPEQILEKSVAELKSAGLSGAKARYIQDLAVHVLEGKLDFDNFANLDNETITQELTKVKGIGEWTTHMFLMFCMGRLDVLPTGDLGIKNGIRQLYGFDHLPLPDEIREIAEQNNWHPYASVASWYIWQSLDNTPKP